MIGSGELGQGQVCPDPLPLEMNLKRKQSFLPGKLLNVSEIGVF